MIRVLLAILLISTTGCLTNGSFSNSDSSSSSNTDGSSDGTSGSGSGSSGTGSSSASSLQISNVTIENTGETPSIKVFFDSDSSSQNIRSQCDSGTKPCSCRFAWTEFNTVTGSNIIIPRVAETVISSVDANWLIGCNLPDAWESEILDDAVVSVSVVPKGTENSSLSTNSFTISKTSNTDTPDIVDEKGNLLFNIHRYTCYEKFSRPMTITNDSQQTQDGTLGITADVLLGTQFQLANSDNSAQSYYYSLYIPSNFTGAINISNNRYYCPEVTPTLASTYGLQDSSTKNFWPLDTSFALAKAASAEFPIGITSPSVLGIQDDSSSAETSCFSDGEEGGGSGNPDSISRKCIGFAMKPDDNGKCGAMIDKDGTERQTYRLRRFLATYPTQYQTTGEPVEQTLGMDEIFVLDRRVENQADPKDPYSMEGPKPCNFAYFDRRGVLGDTTRAYYGTNDTTSGTDNNGWNAKNVDGIIFPNTDTTQSCAATLPFVTYNSTADPTLVSMVTSWDFRTNSSVTINNDVSVGVDKLYSRPQDAWAPHYEEDIEFKACAPAADPVLDPPIYFARNTADDPYDTYRYCAAVYPNMNDKVEPSNAVNGDSNATKRQDLMPNDPDVASITLDGDTSRTGATDRITVTPPGGHWPFFPLLAHQADVEAMLQADRSYACKVTFNASGSTDKSDPSTPSEGCCGPTGSLTGLSGNYDAGYLEARNSGSTSSPAPECRTPNL